MNNRLYFDAFEKIKKEGGSACPNLLVYDSIGSTNDTLKEKADEGFLEGSVIIANCQENGHGRSGRSFFSPSGGNLYISILLRPQKLDFINLITPAAAVATARAIKKVCDKNVYIKWVNDLFIDDRKICGILASGYNLGEDEKRYVVLGIGINVYVGLENVPDEIKNIYGTILNENVDEGRLEIIISELAAAVFDEYMKIYYSIDSRAFVDEYRSKSLVIGRKVSYSSGDEISYVTVEDIDDDCKLVVRHEDGSVQSYNDGEIRIKL